MKTIRIYLIALLSFLGLASCHDFLTENTGDLDYVRTIADIDELLVGDGYLTTSAENPVMGLVSSQKIGSWIYCMDDDIEVFRNKSTLVFSAWEWHYRFSKDPFIGCSDKSQLSAMQEYEDKTWTSLYKQISVVNLILEQLDARFAGDPQYNRLKGESLLLRGQAYLYLVNCYAKPYTPSTAAADPGVPVKLTAPIEDKDYVREPVEQVYAQIVSDLTAAAELLKGIENKSAYRAGATAAHALLSRVYLYMQRWDDAINEADIVLKDPRYALYDLVGAGTLSAENPAVWSKSPEVIFTQGPLYHIGFAQSYYVTPTDLYNTLFPEDDARRGIFDSWPASNYGGGPAGGYKLNCKHATSEGLGIVSNCLSVRLPEIYLNKAEALANRAESNDEADAAALVASLRAKRIKAGGPIDVSERGTALIDAIRSERRKELYQEGHRWFDLKRYAVQTKHPLRTSISHKAWQLDDVSVYEGEFILPAYDPANPGNWLLPIPRREIELNHGAIADNDRVNITATK